MTDQLREALIRRMDAYLSGQSTEATAIIKDAREALSTAAQPASQEQCSGPLCGLPEFGGNHHPLCSKASQQLAKPSETLRDVLQERFDVLHIPMPADPREAITALVNAETAIALNPNVSREAAALVQRGRDDAQSSGEPMTRFCPGCGSVGDVPSQYRDCCPDGKRARMIPKNMADQCHDLFQLALDGARQSAPPKPVPMTDEQMDVLRFLLGIGLIDGCAFGDTHPDMPGLFWWRKSLREAFGITGEAK
jgi:hypothetical protein